MGGLTAGIQESIARYRRFAEEARALSDKAGNEQLRMSFLRMAEGWQRKADELEQAHLRQPPLPAPGERPEAPSPD